MNRRIVSLFMAILLLCTPLMLGGCHGRLRRYQTESFAYFDTVTTIIGYAESEEAFLAEAALIFEELKVYHQLFDIYHKYDGMQNLYTVNEVINGAHPTVVVDARIIELLLYATQMHEISKGAFHFGMGSVLSIWHAHRKMALADPAAATVPSAQALAEAAAHISLDALQIDRENSTVTITDPQMTLDVGAVAKGFATECVARSMEARGLSHYMLNVGGTVRTVGERADGKAWVVGIEDPRTSTRYLSQVALTDTALSASGTYQRYYAVNGVRYHHIIDPKTGQPATGYLSVSVIADDTTLADVLSTALFCMSVEEGKALLAQYPGVEALWLLDDGTLYISGGFDAYLKS